MVELFEQDIRTNDRQSSKGNQLKWYNQSIWYKSDYTGYEGLTEYLISNLLACSNMGHEQFIFYQTEQIRYGNVIYLGCSSRDFLKKGYQLITLERLFQNIYGESLNKSIYLISGVKERIQFLVDQTVRITGLEDFGEYLCRLLTIDALFLNEDRHTHNIAVLMDTGGSYFYCPIFDNGAGLLSDTTMDYPLGIDIYKGIKQVRAKTFCMDFEEQLDAVEQLYGQHLHFQFGEKEIDTLLEKEMYYPLETKERVKQILLLQRRKYSYLFTE